MHLHGGDIYNNLNVIDFSSNINFLGMPSAVREAAHLGVEQSVHYPQAFNSGLEQRIAGFYAENNGFEKISEKHIVCGNGAAEIIFSFSGTVRPKKALLIAPTFYEYEQALTNAVIGCEIERHMLFKENNFKITDDFLNKITQDIDLVCICNPNNPTGGLVEKPLMLKVLKACERVGAWLLVDESFMELVDNYDSYSLCCELNNGMHEGMFVLKSFTKLYAMPGLRLGYGLCANKMLIQEMKETLQPWNVSLPAQYAGIAALQETAFVQRFRVLLAEERKFLYRELCDIGNKTGKLKVYEGAANFLLFYAEEDRAGRVYDACLRQGILIRNCNNFYGLGDGWYRVAVRSHAENIRLLEALRKSI